jgi:hypothetical protein
MTWLKKAGFVSVDENELARLEKIAELARQIAVYGYSDSYRDALLQALNEN